ncbi:RNase H domain-containing protein [Trichonephila clavipes]|nr:RNase H domain-containing protein [Trichonephila clavipes]
MRNSWGSRPQTLKSTFCTVIRPSYQNYYGAVSSTNNEKAEQECGLPPLESRRKLATIKFTNKLRSYGALIPKNPPKNTCFELELLQPCSKKEDPVTLRQIGLETIAILSQDNFAIAYTDGSSDRSLSNGGAGFILLLPDEGLVIFSDSKSAIEAIRNGETNISCDIITLLEQPHNKRKSCILQWIPAHVNIEGHDPDKTRSYVQCKHCPDLQLTPNHILECPTVATKLLKMGMVPLRDSLRELLYSPDAPRIAEAVIKTFDGI